MEKTRAENTRWVPIVIVLILLCHERNGGGRPNRDGQPQGYQEKYLCLQIWEGALVEKEVFEHQKGMFWVTQDDLTPEIPGGAWSCVLCLGAFGDPSRSWLGQGSGKMGLF